MRVNNQAGVAIKLLTYVGAHPDGYTRSELAAEVGMSKRITSKIFNVLMEKGYVSVTYPYSDATSWIYRLLQPTDKISLWEKNSICDGDLINGMCLFCHKHCAHEIGEYGCYCGGEMDGVLNLVEHRLRTLTIQDLIDGQSEA